MKKKLLACLLAVCSAAACVFGLAACNNGGVNNQTQNKWGNEYSFATAYAQAQELGYAGTLEEFVQMISGKDGANGKNGNDGMTPHIGENGNWFIGETDTGVKVTGSNGTNGTNGNDGLGIKEIEINTDNEIIITWTNDTTTNIGKVPPCKHKFSVWETGIDATCTSIGFKYRICSDCNYKDYEFMPSAHTVVIDEAVNPTCIKEGLTEGKHCAVCNTVLVEQTVLEKTQHIWINDICDICKMGKPNTGLEFNLFNDHCTVTGIGKCTDSIINIPSIYNDLPVTTIESRAFQNCSKLTSITIPDSVTGIGNYAFDGCSGLTSIAIPIRVNYIGSYAFRGCSGVTSITVDSKNETYHSAGNCLIETATKALLVGCNNSIIPTDGSVTSIGANAFYYCSGLENITIPDSVTSIDRSAFFGCSGLTSITVDSENATFHSVADCLIQTATKTLILGCKNSIIPIDGSVTSIDGSAFQYRSGLTSITIPESITAIGSSAFIGCGDVTSITVDNRNATYHSAGNCLIETATKTLVTGCKNSIIPTDGSVTSIGDSAFRGLSDLENLIIPDGITSIGAHAFQFCSGLTSITIPDSVTSIGNNAFMGCSELKSITIPDGITSIGNYAFRDCGKLMSITIPDSVTSIGNYAFYNCIGLTGKGFTFKGTMLQWKAIKKGSNWYGYTTSADYNIPGLPDLVINCTDGLLDKNGNELGSQIIEGDIFFGSEA